MRVTFLCLSSPPHVLLITHLSPRGRGMCRGTASGRMPSLDISNARRLEVFHLIQSEGETSYYSSADRQRAGARHLRLGR